MDVHELDRKELFTHYYQTFPCRYSVTIRVDVTNVVRRKLPFYPTMLYAIASVVNQMQAFRYGKKADEIWVYESLSPAYTVWNPQTELFVDIWTDYCRDYATFVRRYQQDVATYRQSAHFFAKGRLPDAVFPVSMIPWLDFQHFSMDAKYGSEILTPFFTIGKYSGDTKITVPLAIDVHHAVCDGYHVGVFAEKLQEILLQIQEL